MATEVLGLFDSRADADDAAKALEAAGFTRSSISIESYAAAGVDSGSSAGQNDQGGWSQLREKLHMASSDDVNYYSQRLQKGQTLVSITTDDASADDAADILDEYGALDADDDTPAYTSGQAAAAPTAGYAAGAALETADKTVIPVVEEELAVGKRQVRSGGVRIYQHVTERPVEEHVTLHSESVVVDRHAVDRSATDADFQNRDFTVTEMNEEAVVAKNARVVEEVLVGKTAQDHTETVRDTVRRTDVQVEDLDDVQSREATR